MLGRGFLAECALRPEVSDPHRVLQRTARRHDLGKQAGKRGIRKRTAVTAKHSAQDLRFALGAISRAVLLKILELADALRKPRAGRQQLDQPLVERVNLVANGLEWIGHGDDSKPPMNSYQQRSLAAPASSLGPDAGHKSALTVALLALDRQITNREHAPDAADLLDHLGGHLAVDIRQRISHIAPRLVEHVVYVELRLSHRGRNLSQHV